MPGVAPIFSGFALAHALGWAAQHGRLAAVTSLLPSSTPDSRTAALADAAEAGQPAIVQLLVPVSEPLRNDSWALTQAAKHGHLDVVLMLIPVSDPKAQDSRALQEAAQHGHLDVVRTLIPVSDPAANGSMALRLAAFSQRVAAVRLLLPYGDRDSNLTFLLCEMTRNGYLGMVTELLRETPTQESLKAALEESLAWDQTAITELLVPLVSETCCDEVFQTLVKDNRWERTDQLAKWVSAACLRETLPLELDFLPRCKARWGAVLLDHSLPASPPPVARPCRL